jgi:hypothetical protein
MNSESKTTKVFQSPISSILLWLMTSGVGISLFAFANEVENKTERNETRQEMIISQQTEMREDFKDFKKDQDEKQQQQLQLLFDIRSKLK